MSKQKKTIKVSYNEKERMVNNKGKLSKLKNDDALLFFDILEAIKSEFKGTDTTKEEKLEEYDISSLQNKKPSQLTDSEQKNLSEFNKEMQSINKTEKEIELPEKIKFSTLKKYYRNEEGSIRKADTLKQLDKLMEDNEDIEQCFNTFDIIDIYSPIIDRSK